MQVYVITHITNGIENEPKVFSSIDGAKEYLLTLEEQGIELADILEAWWDYSRDKTKQKLHLATHLEESYRDKYGQTNTDITYYLVDVQ